MYEAFDLKVEDGSRRSKTLAVGFGSDDVVVFTFGAINGFGSGNEVAVGTSTVCCFALQTGFGSVALVDLTLVPLDDFGSGNEGTVGASTVCCFALQSGFGSDALVVLSLGALDFGVGDGIAFGSFTAIGFTMVVFAVGVSNDCCFGSPRGFRSDDVAGPFDTFIVFVGGAGFFRVDETDRLLLPAFS